MNRFVLVFNTMLNRVSLLMLRLRWIHALCLILVASVGSNRLDAQDLQILTVDSSAYPVIRVSIVYKNPNRFESEQLRLKQDNRDLPYTLTESAPGSAPEKGRAVYFLLEASGNTYGKGIVDLREGVSGAFDNLDPKDLINIAWFGSYESDSLGMQLLSDKFSSRHDQLKQQLYRINASPDSLFRSDLYRNILESLNYISNSKDLPENKLFIVISASRNSSSSAVTSADCIARAKELNIPVYSITYLSSDSAYSSGSMTRISARTGGKNVQSRTQIGIINAITDFFNAPIPKAKTEAKYDLMFTVRTEVNPSKAKIDLNYRGNRQILIVQDPNAGNLIPEDYKKYLWYSIGLLGFIVVAMIIYNLVSRKPQQSDEDSESAETTQEALAVKPAVIAKQEVAPIEKPAKKGPVLLLNQDGRTLSFPIELGKKLSLGRHDSNDIVLKELTVTGKHAEVEQVGEEILLRDLGSTNGTFVNGERIRTRALAPGDKIMLGQVQLTLKE